MRQALPVLPEGVDTLKQRRQHEQHGRKQPRLQMRSLLASGHAHTRPDVAKQLGVHRKTIGDGLALYEAGGLAAWLDIYVPAGKPVSLPPDVLAALEQALRRPAGVASSEALRRGVKQRYPLAVNYHPLYTSVRTRCNPMLTVPRPRHTPPRPSGSFRRPVASGCSASSHP